MQDLTDFEQKVNFFDFLTFCSKSVKLVKSCMNGETDFWVNLSEPVALHLAYSYLNFQDCSYLIWFDIMSFLKSSKNWKSQVKATLP